MADIEQQPLPELLPGLVEAVISVAKLKLPEPSDIFYYRNIPEYKELSSAASSHVQQLLRTARSSLTRPTAAGTAAAAAADSDDDIDDAMFTDLVSVLDDTLERLDVALDASQQQTEQLKLGGWATAASSQGLRALAAGRGSSSTARVAGFSKVQRHVANLARPQESFPDAVDNSNTPWTPAKHPHLAAKLAAARAAAAVAADPLAAHAAQLAAGAGGSSSSSTSSLHPYAAELASLSYQQWQLEVPAAAAAPAGDFDSTPFTFVDTPQALAAMVSALAGEQQIALDLEHHAYRSFQGFTCLLQVSSRSADWVVDSLALRAQLGPALAALLADPAVEKVLHGADSDVQWLQRDFGLYLVNLFDTGQAARVLNYPSASLAYLLERHCGFKPDKRYQLADWRVRPLSPDMLHYARADTHFLLGAADALRAELLAAGPRVPQGWAVSVPLHSGAKQDALGVVLERSRLISATTYQKPLLSEASYLEAAARWGVTLSAANMAVFGALYAWRDATARAMDESVSYVMPKAALLELSRAAPQTAAELKRVLGSGSGLTGGGGFLLTRAEEVAGVVRAGLQQAPAARTAAATATAAAVSGATAAAHVQDTAAAQAAGAGAPEPIKPRVLPALKPKALPVLMPKTKAAAAAVSKSAGGLPDGLSSGTSTVGQAAGDAGAAPRGGQPQQQQQQQQPPLQTQQDGASSDIAEQQQQQQQPQPQPQPQHQEQQAQPKQAVEQQQASQPAPAAPVAPKQLAALPKRGSSMAGLLSGRARQQQPAAKAAALKVSTLKLDFLAAPAAQAAEPGAAAAETKGEQQQQQDEREIAKAPAVTGSQVRALVDQMMADNTAEEEEAAAAAAAAAASGEGGVKDDQQQPNIDKLFEDSSSGADDEATAAAKSGSVLADMDYVPLSAQVQKREGYPAAKRPKLNAAAGQPPQQQHQQQRKRKRGIFDKLADSDSDSSSSDGDDLGAGGMLPSYDPAAANKRRQALKDADANQPHDRAARHDRAAAAADPGDHQDGGRFSSGRGRGRGGRGDSRGGRGGRSKRGGFMAAASASLAAVRKQQGGGVGANPFAIPDSNLMKGGKRSSVIPRGGNRSVSFK